MVKNLTAKQEMRVPSLDQEDPLERKWQPTPVFLPGKVHGQKSLVGHRLWGLKELYMAEHTCTPLPSSKSLGGLTLAMKLKDTCSFERKL